MDERCFRPLLCTVKAELGRGQPGLMRWIWDETLPQSSIDRSTFYSAAHHATKWASGRPLLKLVKKKKKMKRKTNIAVVQVLCSILCFEWESHMQKQTPRREALNIEENWTYSWFLASFFSSSFVGSPFSASLVTSCCTCFFPRKLNGFIFLEYFRIKKLLFCPPLCSNWPDCLEVRALYGSSHHTIDFVTS